MSAGCMATSRLFLRECHSTLPRPAPNETETRCFIHSLLGVKTCHSHCFAIFRKIKGCYNLHIKTQPGSPHGGLHRRPSKTKERDKPVGCVPHHRTRSIFDPCVPYLTFSMRHNLRRMPPLTLAMRIRLARAQDYARYKPQPLGRNITIKIIDGPRWPSSYCRFCRRRIILDLPSRTS